MNEPVEPDDTERLLDLARAGHGPAFDHLFARFRPYLLRLVAARLPRGVRARLDPSDVVQETQLEAFRRLPDYLARRPMTFRLWLRQTARERVLMARRRHVAAARRSTGREAPPPDDSAAAPPDRLPAGGPTASQACSGREEAHRVRAAVAALAPDDREILVMRTIDGLSNAAAAEALGVDPSTASRRYGRALIRLRAVLAAAGPAENPS